MNEAASAFRLRAVNLCAIGCALFVWVFYLFRLAPTTYLLDSSELVNATWSLGISHPPGHPAFHLLSHIAGLLPIGPYPWRIHLFAATCTAAAVGLLPLIADRLSPVTSKFALSSASLLSVLVGTSTALLLQSIRAEVYSLHLVVALLVIWLMLSADRNGLRLLPVIAAVLGLGLLNHHYLVFSLFPGLLLWLVLQRLPARTVITAVAGSVLVGITMIAGYSALLARGAARPHGSWAWPSNFSDLYWVVSAEAFQKTAAKVVTVDLLTGLSKIVLLFMEQLGPFALLLGLLGLMGLAVRRPRVGLPLVALLLFNIATQFIFDFDPWNPDVLGYFMLSVALFGVGVIWLLQTLVEGGAQHNLVRLTAIGLLPLTAVFWVAAQAGDARTRDLSDYAESELFRDAILQSAPADTLWVTAYFETAFQTWYAQGPEDQRPDVQHLHRSFRTYPHYDAMMLETAPALAGVLDANAEVAALSEDGLSAWATRSAVRVEPDELVGNAELDHLIAGSAGLEWSVDPAPKSERDAAAARALTLWTQRFGEPATHELQTARNLLWWSVGYARFMQRTGQREQAAGFVSLALTLSPNDPDLVALMEQLNKDASLPKSP